MNRFRIAKNSDHLELDLEFTWTHLKSTLSIQSPNHRNQRHVWNGLFEQNKHGFVIKVEDIMANEFLEFCIVGISEEAMQELSDFIHRYTPYEFLNDFGPAFPPT